MAKQLTAPQRLEIVPSQARPQDAATLARAIQQVLDAPNPDWFGDARLLQQRYGCDCEHCAARRTETIECAQCGYQGPPLVSACECRRVRRSNLTYCGEKLRDLDTGKVPAPGDFSREQLEALLAKSEAIPNGRCVPRGEPTCGHGLLCCPTCGSDPGRRGEFDGDAGPLLGIIRRVRDAIRELQTDASDHQRSGSAAAG